MLGHDTFYFSLFRKYISLFGSVFNEMHIPRFDVDGNTIKLIKVPIIYSPKEKVLQRLTDTNLQRAVSIQYPAMAFELTGYAYNQEDKLQTTVRFVKEKTGEPGNNIYQFVPVPYDLYFTLYVYSKHAEDVTKIVEQILPFFTPAWTPTVRLIEEMNIEQDVPIILDDTSLLDTYDTDLKTGRYVLHILNFTMKAWFWGPIQDNKVIKFANVSFYVPGDEIEDIRDAVGNTPAIDRVTVQPGLTANGEPTTDIDETIPYAEITAEDDFGYIVDIAGILPVSNT